MSTLVIVDDNLDFVINLYNQIVQLQIPKLQVTCINSNGKEAINTIIKLKPDIVLLDLFLQDISGIDVLDEFIKHKINTKIIVMSGYPDLIYKCHDKKYYNYIYKILAKPFNYKDLSTLLQTLSIENNSKFLRTAIINQLNLLNFSHKSIGYNYLIDTISLILERNYKSYNLEKDIYVQLSKQYKNVKAFKIKWNIEKLIRTMYRDTNIHTLHNFFNTDEDTKPTTKLIINTVIDKCINS